MSKDFTATITNPERAAEWEALLDTTTVHIRSPIPQPASLPGHPKAMIYELDLALITDEQRQRLIQHFHLKFGVPKDTIMQTLNEIGVPILTDDCIVSITSHPLKWL